MYASLDYNDPIPKKRFKGSQLPRFAGGGFWNSQIGSTGMTGGSMVGMGASMLGSIAQSQQPSMSSGIMGGAAKGASMGMALGPWGAAAGAVIGGIGGTVNAKKKMQEAEEQEALMEEMMLEQEAEIRQQKTLQNIQASKAVLKSYPTSGVADATFAAAYGGNIPSSQAKYLAEDDEVIQHAPNDVPRTDLNGNATRLNSDTSLLDGDKHSAPSGGIGVDNSQNARVFSDRLYVPKELLTQLNKL